MATTRLTTKFVESVQPTKGRQRAYPDAQVPGLELRVSPGGRKVWSLRYRNHDGRQRRLSLGVFPSLDLGDARDRAFKALGSLSDGKDPAAERRKAKEAARNQQIRTFNDLADAYIAACEAGTWKPKNKRKRSSTIATERAVLKRHVRPALGKLELSEVTKRRIRNLLGDMVKRGFGAQTNKAHAIIRQVCSFAIADDLMVTNPALGIPPPAEQKPRRRALSDAELRLWWSTLQAWPNNLRLSAKDEEEEGELVIVGRAMRIALQLATLLLQRRGEIAGMAVSELNLDQATWLIPGERAMNGKAHLVPLPSEAVALVREALDLARMASRDDSPAYVFPSRHRAGPFGPDSLTGRDEVCASANAPSGLGTAVVTSRSRKISWAASAARACSKAPQRP